jgi:quercetin dioxygenase-like cupin family protein
MRIAIAAGAMILSASAGVLAQSPGMNVFTSPDELKWAPAPPSLPKGAELVVLFGDPAKDGPFVVRLRMPANYRVPAHHHPTTEDVTVLSGSFHAGMGDKLDEAKAQSFQPGGFVSMPAHTNHYAWTTSETVLQIDGIGPFAITYVNPEDDPSKQQ